MYGFREAHRHAALFVIALLVLVFTTPLMYFTALPFGVSVGRPASDFQVVDEDLSARVLRSFWSRSARTTFRGARNRLTSQAATTLPSLRLKVLPATEELLDVLIV